MKYLLLILVLFFCYSVVSSPVMASKIPVEAADMEGDIPTLIERFIRLDTALGDPHSYAWVIERLDQTANMEIVVEIRVFSVSLDRTTVRDERYRILFHRNPLKLNGKTIIGGYSKLSEKTETCQGEQEKK